MTDAAAPRSGAMVRALVVEDEAPIRRVIVAYLIKEGFDVSEVGNGLIAIEIIERDLPDVIVLDLMLPGIDGIEVCRRLRLFSDAYVVMLTARSEEVDTLIGLSVGADDYVTKPFSSRELVARIHAMMRRPRVSVPAGATRAFGKLRIDPESREVTLDRVPVEFTRTEFDILDVLSTQPRHVYSRERLIDEVWGSRWIADARLVDVHVSHIRAKLGDASSDPKYVLTVRGVGFRMGTG